MANSDGKPAKEISFGVSTYHILSLARQAFQAQRGQMMTIAFVAFILPQMIGLIVFGEIGNELAAEIRNWVESAEKVGPARLGGLVAFAAVPVVPIVSYGLAAGFIFIAGYLALVDLTLAEISGRDQASFSQLIGRSIRRTLQGGLVMAIVLGILVVVGQLLIIPGLIVAIMGMLAPAVLVHDRRGAFGSIYAALTGRVGLVGRVRPVEIFFALSGVAALYLAGVWLTERLVFLVTSLDSIFGWERTLYLATFFGTHLPVMGLVIEALDWLLNGFLLLVPILGGASCFAVLRRLYYRPKSLAGSENVSEVS